MPPRVFLKKRLQTTEKKGREGEKGCKERAKRQQLRASKRVGASERLNDRAWRRRIGCTPVVTGSMGRLLRTVEILTPLGADDARHGEQAGSCSVRVLASSKHGRSFEVGSGTGATMGKGSAGVLEK
jgi:hypothetical protein